MAKLVPNQVAARNAVNKRWPNRDKGSDGWIADKHHKRPSEHIPDSAGWVRAIDTDVDGIHVPTVVADWLIHPSTWYVIWNRRIYRRADDFRPRTYTGKNPHTGHVHRSTLSNPAADRNTTGYPLISGTSPLLAEAVLQKDDRGYLTRQLQALLNANGASLILDSDFGGATDAAVRAFQRRKGLKVDGIAGRRTIAALTGRKP